MGSEPQVRVVVDPADDGSLSSALGRWNDPTTGVAIVNPTPETSTTRGLASEVLCALGKRFDALDRERIRHDGKERWDLACTWLRAEAIRHLVVLDAHRLHPRLRPLLAEVAIPRRALWLIVRTEADAQCLADTTPSSRSTVGELLRCLPPPARTSANGSALTPAHAAQLREIVTPASTCAMALAAIVNADPCALASLPRSSLGLTGRVLTIDDRRFVVPPYARALVRAQLLVRPRRTECPICVLTLGDHRRECEPLFFTAGGRRPTSPQLARWLRRSTGTRVCWNPMLNVWPPPPRRTRDRRVPMPDPLTETCRVH